MNMGDGIESAWKESSWYKKLDDRGKCLADFIHKYHKYFSDQDKKYRILVRFFKVTILILAMISTIILGIKSKIEIDTQVLCGLILSALITFVTAVSSYFNFEEYWMRNISIHIQLNILRDNFILEAEAGRVTDVRIDYYMEQLNTIQKNNISYWEKAIKRI